MADRYEQAAQQRGSGIMPANEDPKLWMTRAKDIRGGTRQYDTLEDFIELHPNIMERGMEVKVNSHDRSGTLFTTKTYELNTLPDAETEYPLSLDPDNALYFLNFWVEKKDTGYIGTRVYEYAPDYTGGGRPPFPYIESDPGNPGSPEQTQYDWEVANWTTTRDSNADPPQTWLRFRDGAGPWSIPLPITGALSGDDYVENRFGRLASLPDTPSRTLNGLPNNEPYVRLGGVSQGYKWMDKVQDALGSGDLYKIQGQKSVYGQLKSDWIGPILVPEDLNLTRYSKDSTPDPNGIVGTSTTIILGDASDTALIAAGWISTPTEDTVYMASRKALGGGTYSDWYLSKTTAESGEYPANIFKLLPSNATTAYLETQRPTGDLPSGWSDTPLQETDNLINYISTTIKFYNGINKQPWSIPRPFTGRDLYVAYITTDLGDTFKYSGSSTPSNTENITLTAHLDLGDIEDYDAALPAGASVTYQWRKLTNISGESFPVILGTSRTEVINHTDVNGVALFDCIITITQADTVNVVKYPTYEIRDNNDGISAKILELTSDRPVIPVDSGGEPASPTILTLRAIHYNLTAGTFSFEYESSPDVWTDLTGLAGCSINQSEAKCTIDLNTTDGAFSSIGHWNGRTYVKYRVTHTDTDVDDDRYTVLRLDPADIGTAGESAVQTYMSNETTDIITDETGEPESGEVGGTYAASRIKTLLQNYEGVTQRSFTIGSVSVVGPPNTTLGTGDNQINVGTDYVSGDDKGVYISHWGVNVNKASVSIPMTVTLGDASTINRTKVFVISRRKNNNVLRWAWIDVDNGFDFTEVNTADKTLTPKLYDESGEVAITTWKWKVVKGPVKGISAGSYINSAEDTTLVLGRVDVTDVGVVRVEITYNGILYVDDIQIVDRPDGSLDISYYHYQDGSIPAEPIPSPTKLGDGVSPTAGTPTGASATGWYANSGPNTYWYSMGQENAAGTLIWGSPVRSRGEKGDQGTNGDGYVYMYKTSTGTPVGFPSSTIAQMQAAGWSTTIPAGTVYITQGIFKAGYTTANAPIGGWTTVRQFSGSDGPEGTGSLTLVAYAEDNSGTGFATTPGASHKYISVKSTSNLSQANNAAFHSGNWLQVRLDPVDTGYWDDADWIQLGSTSIYYRKDVLGVVHMFGSSSQQIGTIGTLPIGYRPVGSVKIFVDGYEDVKDENSNTIAVGVIEKVVSIESSGNIIVSSYTSSATNSAQFNGVSFMTTVL